MMMIMMMMPGLHPPHLPAPRVLARLPGGQPRDGLRPQQAASVQQENDPVVSGEMQNGPRLV